MSTIFGMIIAFSLIIGAIALGGTPLAYWNVQGLLIVVLGTFAVTAISYRPSDIISVPANIWQVLRHNGGNLSGEAVRLLKLAAESRKHQDLLGMEKILPRLKDTPFLLKAITMVIDGNSAEDIEQNLRRDSGTISGRHGMAIDILRRMGDIAPAMGLIGTLIGLVQMLGNLDDPALIGPSMAVALLTTFYGAVLAQLVFIPLAAKAEQCSIEENLLNNLYAMGAASISRRENPRRLEMLLNTVLPPADRVTHFK